MNQTLCATLLTVFPVFLLIFMVESRAVAASQRKRHAYTVFVGTGAVAGLAGIVLTGLGVQFEGLAGGWAFFAWVVSAVDVVCVTVLVLLLAHTYDLEDNKKSALLTALRNRNRKSAGSPQDEPSKTLSH